MLMECSLNATPATTDSTNVNDHHYKSTADLSVAEAFLKQHSTAKIVFIVNTHCLPDGFFVYLGDSPDTYKSCSLLEVSLPHASHPLKPQPPCRSSGTVHPWVSSSTSPTAPKHQGTTTGVLS